MPALTLIPLKLAVYIHDPVWKPWGMLVRPYNMEGCGSRPLDKCIVEKVRDRWSRIDVEYLEELLKRMGVAGVDKKALERLADAFRKAAEKLSDVEGCGVRKSHERQAIVALIALRLFLEMLGKDEAIGESVVGDAARVVGEAIRLVCENDARVHGADGLASAIDRFAFTLLAAKRGGEVQARSAKIVNIFNPELSMEVRNSLGVEKVVEYVTSLYTLLALALMRARGEGDVLVYHLLFALTEPVWYRVVGSQYVPPADTRVPTHTIFDHLSAATMASNWLVEGEKPEGCLVIVDLASVQSWISEARRLRDLWAASWLASWLAWKTVEGLVSELGPDILVQPPARLHPFYTAWLLSKIECKDSGEDEFCRSLAEMLGLKLGWPLDPTVPTRLVIALPPKYCREAKERIAKAYREAWRSIMRRVAEKFNRTLGELRKVVEADGNSYKITRVSLEKKIWKLVGELEPPLPLRVFVRDVELAWSKANDICRGALQPSGNTCIEKELVEVVREAFGERIKECQRLLLYPILVNPHFWNEKLVFRTAGRRTSPQYLVLARSMFENGCFRACHVCGHGVVVVDGDEMSKALEQVKGKVSVEVRRFVAEVSGERLCPYCLAKRLLRQILQESAEELVGIKLTEEARARIGTVTVDAYTTRTWTLLEDMLEKLEEWIEREPDVYIQFYALYRYGLVALQDPPMPGKDSKLMERWKKLLDLARERLSRLVGGEGSVEAVRAGFAALLEALHNEAFTRMLREKYNVFQGVVEKLEETVRELRRRAREKLGREPRADYAIIASDADRMGSGVLAGRLGIRPCEYARKAYNVGDEKLVEDLEKFFNAIVKLYECNVKQEDRGYTLLVTPSYHFTVSRALAATAMIDRDIVEAFGGFIVYSGGDDLLAVAAPAALDWVGKGRVLYPALYIVYASRRAYWGLRPKLEAKLETLVEPRSCLEIIEGLSREGLPLGFNLVGKVPVPALTAYGRSYVVYYVDSKRPLWFAVREAHEHLESKDTVTHSTLTNDLVEKDVLVVASVASGAAALPLVERREAGVDGVGVGKTLERVFVVLDLVYRRMSRDRAHVTASIFDDSKLYVLEMLEVMLEAVRGAKKSLDTMVTALNRLIEHIVSRNVAARTNDERLRLTGRVKSVLSVDGQELSITLLAPREAVRSYYMDGFSVAVECGRREDLSTCRRSTRRELLASDRLALVRPLHVLNAARITRVSGV